MRCVQRAQNKERGKEEMFYFHREVVNKEGGEGDIYINIEIISFTTKEMKLGK
jgi:hypothetical protein